MNSSFNNSINITVMQMQRKNAEADELWSTEHITMLACVFFIPIITISIVIAICKTIEYRREGSESQQSGKKKRRHSKKRKKKKTTTKRKSERYVNTDGTKRSLLVLRGNSSTGGDLGRMLVAVIKYRQPLETYA